jgi:hypothetical protein
VSQKVIIDRRGRILQLSEYADMELTAKDYLEQFPNLSKHLKAKQMLQYLQKPQPK